MMTRKRSNKIVNFMNPGGSGTCTCSVVWPDNSYGDNVLFVSNSFLLVSIDQTK